MTQQTVPTHATNISPTTPHFSWNVYRDHSRTGVSNDAVPMSPLPCAPATQVAASRWRSVGGMVHRLTGAVRAALSADRRATRLRVLYRHLIRFDNTMNRAMSAAADKFSYLAVAASLIGVLLVLNHVLG